LIPLFAIGAFLALHYHRQVGVVHWLREKRSAGWVVKAAFNSAGALATGTTVLVVAISKFVEGAWITVIVIPLIVLAFHRVRQHYDQVRNQLSMHGFAAVFEGPVSPHGL